MASSMEKQHEGSVHVESPDHQHLNQHGIAALAASSEDEPQTPYQLGWKTILALLTLSMGNVCAALSNTVSHIIESSTLLWVNLIITDKHND
jgi:hypothetical protein